MKRKRFTETQMIQIVKELEGGTPIEELCRKHGAAKSSVYAWRRKYSGMEVHEARRLKELEEENRRLKKLVADQALDIDMLKHVNSKKW